MTINASNARVALVTGSARRLGRAIAERLADDGFAIALHYNTSESEALALQAQLQSRSARATLHQADLSMPNAIQAMALEVNNEWGRLDALVNCASVFGPEPFMECDEDSLLHYFRTNAAGPFFMCQKFLPLLRGAGGGHIVNITDIYADRPLRGHIPYAMSKAALAMLTKSLAVELAPDNIRVNAVAPGAALLPEGVEAEYEKKLVQRIPLGRLAGAEEIAHAVSYLVHSEFVTGVTIPVDGGRSLAP